MSFYISTSIHLYIYNNTMITGTPQVSAAVLRKLSGSNLFEDEKDAVYVT